VDSNEGHPVTLSHHSVKEYLTSERFLSGRLSMMPLFIRRGHLELAEVCQTYILLGHSRMKNYLPKKGGWLVYTLSSGISNGTCIVISRVFWMRKRLESLRKSGRICYMVVMPYITIGLLEEKGVVYGDLLPYTISPRMASSGR